MLEKIGKFRDIARNFGWKAATIILLRHLLGIDLNSIEIERKMRDALKWNFSRQAFQKHAEYRKTAIATVKTPKSIHWILPRLSAGSGGHRTASRMIQNLIDRGYDVTVWINNPRHSDIGHLAADMERFYGVRGCTVRELQDPSEIKCDALIATDAWTAFPAAVAETVGRKYYFVQDYEPLFQEAGSASVFLDYTYSFGFYPITAGTWLKTMLKSRFNQSAGSFNLAVDHEIYNTNFRKDPELPTIVFYARGNTPRRCVELGFMALELLKQKLPEVQIILFGFEGKGSRLRIGAEIHGIIPPTEIAKLYARSTIGLSLSATNHSLIPNEMMASGLPVLELNTPNNTSVYPKGTVSYADPHPALIAEKAVELLSNGALRNKIRQKSIQYTRQLTWSNAALAVERHIIQGYRNG